MRVGGGNCGGGCGPQQSIQSKGGSGEKAKGGSGEKSNPGHGGMPPGLAKKMQDGFDTPRTSTNAQDGNPWDQKSGGGLGAVISNAVNGFLSNMLGGWGGRADQYLGASPSSTPTAVAEGQKNQSTNPVVDLGNQA